MKIKPICRMPGCGRTLHCRGYCFSHYKRSLIAGDVAMQPDDVIERARVLMRDRPMTMAQLADAFNSSTTHARNIAQQAAAVALFSVTLPGNTVPSPMYSCLRNDAAHALSLIHKHLTARPELSSKEIGMLCRMSESSIRAYVAYLHNAELVHVGRWTVSHQQKERLWVFGPGDDAPRPVPLTRKQINQRAAERCKHDPDALANRRSIARRTYHRRNSKPKRDPLIAALFGEAA